MLFNDPYKNIHGYTVSMPDDSSPIDPLGRKVKVNNTRPARTNQSNNGGAAVGVLLFFMLIFSKIHFFELFYRTYHLYGFSRGNGHT